MFWWHKVAILWSPFSTLTLTLTLALTLTLTLTLKLPFLAKKGTSKLPKLATKCHCFPIEKMPTQNCHFWQKKGTPKLPNLATKCHCFSIEKMPTQNCHFWQKKGTSKLPKLATKCHCFSIEKMLAQNCHFWQFCGLKIAKIGKIEGATKLPKMAFEHICGGTKNVIQMYTEQESAKTLC